MSARIHLLARALLQTDSLQNVSLDELRSLAEQHPYCAPARFLLVQRLRAEGGPEYDRELGKAVLYYHHPVQLAGLLEEDRFTAEPSEPLTEAAFPTVEIPLIVEPQEELVVQVPPEEDLRTEEAAPIETPSEQATPEPLAFEPFHTVDYFASQGIKLSQDDVGKDRFGRQLKSFTEWLKTMKRLPQPDASTPLDSQSEQQVTALASRSVSTGDVVTEAMAEVWLKQGNRERAREVYHKLSLLHPAKSAYFAAKLDQIQS